MRFLLVGAGRRFSNFSGLWGVKRVARNLGQLVKARFSPKPAVIQQFGATANSSGQIVIQFTTVGDNAQINGIEID